MAATRDRQIYDQLTWPWPRASWQAGALGSGCVAPPRRTGAAWSAAALALDAVVLVIALTIFAGLGSVGVTGIGPGDASASGRSIERLPTTPAQGR
jgi:hypothetical protein